MTVVRNDPHRGLVRPTVPDMEPTPPPPELLDGLGVGVVLLLVALYVALIAFSIYVYVRIINKAGYSGWWVLTALVPVLNVVMIVVFAFADWPVQQRARAAEQQLRALPPGAGGSGRFGSIEQPPRY